MAAITATAVAVAPDARGGVPLIVIVTSSAAVYQYSAESSIWRPLPMVTT